MVPPDIAAAVKIQVRAGVTAAVCVGYSFTLLCGKYKTHDDIRTIVQAHQAYCYMCFTIGYAASATCAPCCAHGPSPLNTFVCICTSKWDSNISAQHVSGLVRVQSAWPRERTKCFAGS